MGSEDKGKLKAFMPLDNCDFDTNMWYHVSDADEDICRSYRPEEDNPFHEFLKKDWRPYCPEECNILVESKGSCTLVDVGGGYGDVHCKLRAASGMSSLETYVLEVPKKTEDCRKKLHDIKDLHFISSDEEIEACDVLLFSASFQHVKRPLNTIKRAIELGCRFVVFGRMATDDKTEIVPDGISYNNIEADYRVSTREDMIQGMQYLGFNLFREDQTKSRNEHRLMTLSFERY